MLNNSDNEAIEKLLERIINTSVSCFGKMNRAREVYIKYSSSRKQVKASTGNVSLVAYPTHQNAM